MNNREFFKDGRCYPLALGKSFYDNKGDEEFLTLKYDFRPPQSNNQEKEIEVDDSKNVSVTIRDDHSDKTVYKGSETEALRECLLIVDHKTQTISLERVGKKMQVKRTRKPGSHKVVNQMHDSNYSRSSAMSTQSVPGSMPALDFDDEEDDEPPQQQQQQQQQQPMEQQNHSMPSMPNSSAANGQKSQFDSSSSSSSGSSSDSSDSDSDNEEPPPKRQPQQQPSAISSSMLIDDLELSEDEE